LGSTNFSLPQNVNNAPFELFQLDSKTKTRLFHSNHDPKFDLGLKQSFPLKWACFADYSDPKMSFLSQREPNF
jgi:hypothetical protein